MKRFSGSVSRETFEKFQIYANLLGKWNRRINLVSTATLSEVYDRHILDSLQLVKLVPQSTRTWADFGSGAGFPGMVVALASSDFFYDLQVTLMESDQRKCSFLKAVSRETSTSVKIVAQRIESVEPCMADVVSARALAALDRLLDYADRHLNKRGTALFMKGEQWQDEVNEAKARWHFDHQAIKSETDEKARILKVTGAQRV